MKKYDFICPIGESCITSYNLRRKKLQLQALPFDWLMDFKLESFVHYLLNNFSDFMLLENLELYLDIPPTSCDHYKDKQTGTLFVHCFQSKTILQNEYPLVKEKFDRRITRMQENIKNANKILFVYTSKTDCYSNSDLIDYYNKIIELYPAKTIDFLYILPIKEKCTYKKFKVSSNITKIIMTFTNDKISADDEWKGIKKLWDKALSQIKLKKKNTLFDKVYQSISKFAWGKSLKN